MFKGLKESSNTYCTHGDLFIFIVYLLHIYKSADYMGMYLQYIYKTVNRTSVGE